MNPFLTQWAGKLHCFRKISFPVTRISVKNFDVPEWFGNFVTRPALKWEESRCWGCVKIEQRATILVSGLVCDLRLHLLPAHSWAFPCNVHMLIVYSKANQWFLWIIYWPIWLWYESHEQEKMYNYTLLFIVFFLYSFNSSIYFCF